jgi:hypothetical protein
MLEFLAGSVVLFWVLTAALVVSVIISLEKSYLKVSFASVVIYLFLLEVVLKIGFFSWLYHNPMYAGVGVVGFFIGATAIVWPKWKWLCDDELDRVEELLKEFLNNLISQDGMYSRGEKLNPEVITYAKEGKLHPSMATKFKEYALEKLTRERGYRVNQFTPQISDHKEQVLAWMIFWPIVLVWSLFDDVIRKICRSIYNRIAGLLQKISDRTFAEFNKRMASLNIADKNE